MLILDSVFPFLGMPHFCPFIRYFTNNRVYLPTLLSPADAEVNERGAVLVHLELNTGVLQVSTEQVITTVVNVTKKKYAL